MKLLLVWGVAGLAYALLFVLQKMSVIDGMIGAAYGLAVVGYLIGIVAATWAIVDKPVATNSETAPTSNEAADSGCN